MSEEANPASAETRSDSVRGEWDRVWEQGSGRRSLLRRIVGAPYRALMPDCMPFCYLLREWLGRRLPLKTMRVLEIGGAGAGAAESASRWERIEVSTHWR